MKKFFANLLSNSSTVSSKRFTALVGLILLVVAETSIIIGKQIPPELLYVLSGLILGSSAMTLAQKKLEE
jgi:hypothetical protein